MSPPCDTLTTPEALTIRVFRSLDDLPELSKAWEALLAEYPLATTFSSMEWLTSWWQSFGTPGQMVVLALFGSDLRLVGVAPLSIFRERFGGFLSLRVLRLMGDGSGDSDNLDLPVRPGFEKRLAQAVLQYIEKHTKEWDLCQLNTMPPDSPVARAIVESLKPNWVFFESLSVRSSIPLPEAWDEYLQRLCSEDRKNLERYERRLEKRYSTRIYRCTRESELEVCLEALFRLHQLRWQNAGEPGSFVSPQRREFYRQLSHRLLDRGLLEFWAIELDGAIVAAQFAFRFRNKVFQLQEGYDPERASDRVGFILRGAVIKQLISEGIQTYDFLGGTDPYKTRWGAQVGYYRNLQFASSWSVGGAWLRSIHCASESKSWLRDVLPKSAWNFLHNINLTLKGRRDKE
jgi:CelD/BcsL family acetyltransferase involved in cellulose biosynthesis